MPKKSVGSRAPPSFELLAASGAITPSTVPFPNRSGERDVEAASLRLLRAGAPGETYNLARGEGSSIRELLDRLAKMIGVQVEPEIEPSLARAGDIAHLVGDSTKLRRATGWAPSRSLEQTLRGLVDAEAY